MEVVESLRGKRCIVTGGGSGIGRGIAETLARQGAVVAVTGRTESSLQETVARIGVSSAKDKRGGRGLAVKMDVVDRDATRTAVEECVKQLGGLDILVNNAGAGGPNACAKEGPDRWDQIVRTNLDGVFHVTEPATKHLSEAGRVINISSVLGRFGVPGYTAYCASKHGVIGFTKALALELAPQRITVNAICPGWVDTEMAASGMKLMASEMGVSFTEARQEALSMVPLQRILEPLEIGGLVAWLASDAAAGMTGQAINHCGGQVMW